MGTGAHLYSLYLRRQVFYSCVILPDIRSASLVPDSNIHSRCLGSSVVCRSLRRGHLSMHTYLEVLGAIKAWPLRQYHSFLVGKFDIEYDP